MKICVLGAGVVGLNSALELQKQYRNAQITLIAEKFNRDTTSDGAAGLFMPVTGFKGQSEEIAKEWITDSYNYYSNLMKTESSCGIIPISGSYFSDISQEASEGEYLKHASLDYRVATEEDKKPYNVDFKYGIHLSTMVIPCRKYLPWALEKFKYNGGLVHRAVINNVDSLAGDNDVLFNCTGLNSRYLFNDTYVLPVRGVVVQVLAPWVKNFCVRDCHTYIIPCGYDNMVTLGGTSDFCNFSTTVDPYVINSITYRCTQILPELQKAPIVRKWVGFRPHRHSIRVETEIRNNLKIIHNYGHGGSGVTVSPGTSIHAVKLFNNLHRASGTCKL